MASFIRDGLPLLNVDWNPPLDPDQSGYWQKVDIMDQEALERAIGEFAPTHIVHLAARTDTDEPVDVDAYRQNHEGTRRLLEVVKRHPVVERIIVTSTQFVCEAGYQPKNDLDFKPYTVYGESRLEPTRLTKTTGVRFSHPSVKREGRRTHPAGCPMNGLTGGDGAVPLDRGLRDGRTL
jgi:nucleoside-diphosphate-sugar epimerase